ncbi:hypothetical protein H5410_015299, partial [Solanum commersonii]
FLWKRRNTSLHGGLFPYEKLIYDINNSIHKLIFLNFPFLQNLPKKWPHMLQILEEWKPRVKGRRIIDFTNQNIEAITISEWAQFCCDRGFSVVKEVEVVNIIRECVPTQLKHTLREGDTLANCFGNLFIL